MKITTIIKGIGIGTFALGIIHTTATPYVAKQIANVLDYDNYLTFTYMFVATGISLLPIGMLIFYTARLFEKNREVSRFILINTIGYVFVLGLSAVCIMPQNPFAIIMLVVAVIGFYPIKKLYVHSTS